MLQLDGPIVIEVSLSQKFAMGLASTSICQISPEYPWVPAVSLYLPLSDNDRSWFLMYKVPFLILGISAHILHKIVVCMSSVHSSDFSHVFGDGEHLQNS
jgi:hypothetical protein